VDEVDSDPTEGVVVSVSLGDGLIDKAGVAVLSAVGTSGWLSPFSLMATGVPTSLRSDKEVTGGISIGFSGLPSSTSEAVAGGVVEPTGSVMGTVNTSEPANPESGAAGIEGAGVADG
jgi:hypothetical protein